jgi:hypothetical protein
MKNFPSIIFLICFCSLAYCSEFPQDAHKGNDSSSTVDYNSTSFSVGIGNNIQFKEYNETSSNWNFSIYLNLHLYKSLYLYTGFDKYDHHSYETSWMFFLGPSYKFNIIHKKIDFDINISINGIITGTSPELPGLDVALFFTPMIKYYVYPNISFGLELRNNFFLESKTNYSLNPLLFVSLNL